MAVGLLASAGTAVAVRFFVKYRATVIGFNSGAVPAGMFVFMPIILATLEAYGWRAACLTTASFGLPMLLYISLYMTDYPADWGLAPYGSEAMVQAPPRKQGHLFALATAYVMNTFVEPAQTGLFWTLTLGFCACGYTSFGLISTFMIPTAVDHGMPLTSVSLIFSLLGICDIVGTLCAGVLVEKGVSPKYMMVFILALRAITVYMFPLVIDSTITFPLLLNTIILGLDYFAFGPPMITMIVQRWGPIGPAVFGWSYAIHQFFSALGASIPAIQHDMYGSFTPGWQAGGTGALLVAMFLLLALPASGKVEESKAMV